VLGNTRSFDASTCIVLRLYFEMRASAVRAYSSPTNPSNFNAGYVSLANTCNYYMQPFVLFSATANAPHKYCPYQDAEKVRQLCSRVDQRLNVRHRVRIRLFARCGRWTAILSIL
jgi:hypothetical protein